MKCNTYEMTQLKIKLVKEIVGKVRKIRDVSELLERKPYFPKSRDLKEVAPGTEPKKKKRTLSVK